MPLLVTEFIQSIADGFKASFIEFVWMGVFGMVISALTFTWLWVYRKRSAWLPIIGGMLLAYGTFIALAVALRWLDLIRLAWSLLFLLLVFGSWFAMYRITQRRREQERRLSRHPKGFLDHYAEFEKNREKWRRSYECISKSLTKFGTDVLQRVTKDGNLDAHGSKHALRHVNAVGRMAAKFAIEIDSYRFNFQRHSETLINGLLGKIEYSLRVDPKYRNSRKAADDLISMRETVAFLKQAMGSQDDFLEKLSVPIGASQEMNAGIAEAQESILGVRAVLERLLATFEDVVRKLEPSH